MWARFQTHTLEGIANTPEKEGRMGTAQLIEIGIPRMAMLQHLVAEIQAYCAAHAEAQAGLPGDRFRRHVQARVPAATLERLGRWFALGVGNWARTDVTLWNARGIPDTGDRTAGGLRPLAPGGVLLNVLRSDGV